MRFFCYVLILFALLTTPPAIAQTSTVTMPTAITVGVDTTTVFNVGLSTPAASGSVTITLTSSDPDTAAVWPPMLVIPIEMTTPPRLQPTITGHRAGTATISAVAAGYTTATMLIQVGGQSGSSGTISLTPANLTIPATTAQNLTVVLSSPAPTGGVSISVSSSNSSVATVTSVVNVSAGSTTAALQVNGVAAGSATITASAGTYGTATASIVVSSSSGSNLPSITVPGTLSLSVGDVKDYAIQLSTAAPANGSYLTITSSDTSKVTLSQSALFIPEGRTSAPRAVTTLNAVGSGAATVSVTGSGYIGGTTQVQVAGASASGTGTLSLSPTTLSLTGTASAVLTIALSTPAGDGGATVSLSSSNTSVAAVPATINVTAGTTTYNVQVTGVGPGTAVITATAASYGTATATVTVSSGTASTSSQGTLVVSPTLTLYPGAFVAFPVTLASPAGSGGVEVTLTSSDSTKAVVSPTSFVVPEGTTASRTAGATVTGVSAGSVTVTASASGFADAVTQVQVKSAGVGGSMTFSPASLSLVTGSTQSLTLNVTGTLPQNGLTVYFTSSNTSVATVPGSINVSATTTSIQLPVTAIASGSSTITATASSFGSATASATILATPQITVPSSVSLAAGETINFPVTVSTAATADVVITLSTSDSSKLTIAPLNLTISKSMTSNPNVTTTVTGINAGTATVTATAPGYTAGTTSATVTAPTTSYSASMGLSPSNLSITGFVTQSLTLTLSKALSSAVLVTLQSSNAGVASVPNTVTVPANTTTIAIAVTAFTTGSTVITATANAMQSATATVTVVASSTGGTLTLPASWSVSPNQSNNLTVILNPAPTAAVNLIFTSSDPSTVTLTPTTVPVASGATSATVLVNGIAAGTSTISVTAAGYTSASIPVQVYMATGSSAFIPGVVVINNTGITETVSLGLGPQSPAGLTVTLLSSDPTVASVPSTVVVPAGSYTVNVPVTGVNAGSVTIIGTTPGFGTATLNVTVLSTQGVTIDWYGICWSPATDSSTGITYYRHAMDFLLTTPSPVMLQGSLFYTSSDCTGTFDNMNDNGLTFTSTHRIQGFLNYPYPTYPPGSAIYWIGARTDDGKCPAGSLCSGCQTYTAATPMCDTMP